MTIKKPMKVVKPAGGAAAPAAASGAATISDRFKLDAAPVKKGGVASGGPGTKYAFFAGLIALAVAGFLTYMLWKHWEFLMPA